MDPENDTGILVTSLHKTIEESRRLREDLKQGGRPGASRQDGAPLEEDGGAPVTSPDPPAPPG